MTRRRQTTVEPVTHHEERLHREQRGTAAMRVDGLWLMTKGLAGIVLIAALVYGLYWVMFYAVDRWK